MYGPWIFTNLDKEKIRGKREIYTSTGRKHCGKRKECMVPADSLFSRLLPRDWTWWGSSIGSVTDSQPGGCAFKYLVAAKPSFNPFPNEQL